MGAERLGDRLANGRIPGLDAVEDELVDHECDGRLYVHAHISASVSGRPSFSPSRLAARAIWPMPISAPSSAARNAAASAMFLMLPPARPRRARAATSRPAVGASSGKIRRQI